MGYIFITLFLPLVSMIVARILLGFILVIHKNKELVKTIKKILEVFPEGIIIQSLDKESKELIVQFANETASNEVLNYKEPIGKQINDEKLNYEIKLEDDAKYSCLVPDENISLSALKLSKFLKQHIELIKNKDGDILSSVEFCEDKLGEDVLKLQFYNIRTLKVKWKSNNDSFIHVFINTTAVKKFEKEKARNECLQLMFSSVSHEFRTPINAFMNSIQFLESNYQDTAQMIDSMVQSNLASQLLSKRCRESNEKFFKICRISSTSLLCLVEDILDLAKIEAGTFSLNYQPFKLDTLIKEIEYIFEFQWVQKGITFNVNIDKELINSSFCSDIGRVKQIVINLISNACKFTMEGGINLHVSSKVDFDPVKFERWRFLIFKVSDTGIGIHEKEIPKLFKLFGTVNQYQNNINSRGTGLGLSISKKIVESLGGTIGLKSKIGEGTKVKFSIKEKKQEYAIIDSESE